MRKILLYSAALVVLSGVAEAACIQTPTCSSLGYDSSSSCEGGIKCPFGNYWNCTAADLNDKITELTNKITEQTNKMTEITNKITAIEEKIATIESGSSSSNCQVGDILYSDRSCSPDVISDKTPIGVVFSQAKRLAIALDATPSTWSSTTFDVPLLTNVSSATAAEENWQGKYNTRLVLEYCIINNYSCPAFEYVNSYKTDGTAAGDWYLPAPGELKEMYLNKSILSTTLNKIGGSMFMPTYHWSSSEYSQDLAWLFNFNTGIVGTNYDKLNNNLYVRPVLAF